MNDAPAKILESVLYAEDLDAAETFYCGVLGFERRFREGDRHVFFQCGDQMLLIFNPAQTKQPPRAGGLPVPPHGTQGAGHLCFAAPGDMLGHWRARLVGAGIAIEADIVWPQGGKSFYFRDPAGNSLEFAEPRIWGL